MVEFGSEIGRVLFFDHKKGWGFIKIVKSNNDYENKDIFTHFSSINCNNSFKKLYPGEYVSLDVLNDESEVDENKRLKSSNVTGVFGGDLLVDNESYNFRIVKINDFRSAMRLCMQKYARIHWDKYRVFFI